MASRYGGHDVSVSLETGVGTARRRVAHLGFDASCALRLDASELARLREVASTVRAEDQDAVQSDPIHAIGEERVSVWRGGRRVVVRDRYGRLTMPGAGDLARPGEEYARRHLPDPS